MFTLALTKLFTVEVVCQEWKECLVDRTWKYNMETRGMPKISSNLFQDASHRKAGQWMLDVLGLPLWSPGRKMEDTSLQILILNVDIGCFSFQTHQGLEGLLIVHTVRDEQKVNA